MVMPDFSPETFINKAMPHIYAVCRQGLFALIDKWLFTSF